MPLNENQFNTHFTNNRIDAAIWIAGAAWADWKDCFEATAEGRPLPVLHDLQRYKEFLKQYRVLRPADVNTRNDIRVELSNSNHFNTLVAEGQITLVDHIVNDLATTHPDLGRQRSFVSKVAAFARPDCFVAYDQYASRGAALLCDGPRNGAYESYEQYMSDVNLIRGHAQKQIQKRLTNLLKKPSPFLNADRQQRAFELRVLDGVLMMVGGRWSHIAP
jgi:hypothetical protein